MTTNKSNESIGETIGQKCTEAADDDEMDGYDEDEEGGRRMGDIYIPPAPSKPAYSGEETGIRLIITNIENINFKSYANRQLLGPFHKSFTSIVGPNGSGKSNVIDSMLFVFGYRAQKLRSKKLSVLIHNSDAFPNLTFCKVIVHFALINDKPGEDFEFIEDSEFTVSRTAHKDSSSYYCINDRKVQFKEVSKLLEKHGIDLRYNRFLILQGEVEQISLMKPKADTDGESGMLEFLEDIIGTTRLKAPLAQLALKVEELNEIRSEKMNRVKVVEKEMKSLEEAKNEAIRFLEAENQMCVEKSKLYQCHRSEANAERERAENEFKRANDIYEKAMQEINELVTQRQLTEDQQKLMAQQLSLINKQSDELNEKYKDCERRDVQLRDRLKNVKTKGKKLEKTIDDENQKLEELMQMPDKCSEQIQELTQKKEKVESDLNAADEHLALVMGEIKADTEPLQLRKDEIEKQLLELQKGVNETRSQKDIAKQELDLYLSEEQNQKSRLQQLNYKLEKTSKESKDKQTALQRFETEIPSAEHKLNELKAEMQTFEQKKSKLVEEHRNTNNRLMELKHSAVDTTSKSRVLNALMDQKKKGNIKGILGRLGDLGAIDMKYDVAVSTACGGLDSIVTETIDDATKCVEFLKKSGVGFGHFIALDKMSNTYRDNRWMESQSYPEDVSRVFDLIRVNDDRVRVAFFHGLKNTLVAKDVDQASRIAYGRTRYRVVTLKGELIEISGTMTGGGRPISGKMGTSVAVTQIDEQEIRALEEEVNRLKHKMNEVNNRFEDLSSESERLTKDIAVMKQNKPQFEMEFKQFDKMLTDLNKQIKEQEERVKKSASDPKRVKELEARTEATAKKYEKEEQKCLQFNKELDEMNDKISEIMDKKVGSARRRVEELKGQLKRINTDLSKANVALTTCERNIEKSREKLKTLEAEKSETLSALMSTKEELKQLEVEATQVSKDYELAVNEKEEADQKFKAIQTKINKIKGMEGKLNNENIDAKHEVEQQKVKLDEKEAEVSRFTHLLKALELHQIDGKPNQSIPELSAEEIENLNSNGLQKEIENIDKELKKMKPNMAAIEDYRKKETVFLERAKQLSDITAQRNAFKAQFEEIRELRLKEFKDGFITIARKLKEMYRMITLGGDAELEYIDSLDPFSEGVTFAVRPNKKSWKKISNLSGGEKTLSSLALIFALHYYKPSPLYVMDEIDAALDFKNVSIVANYIKQRTRNTQFIIISLRNNMYELADRLVGIYKTSNCTKSVTINPTLIEDKRLDRRTITLSSANSASNEFSSQTTLNQNLRPEERALDQSLDNITSTTNTSNNTNSINNSVFVN